MTQTEKRGCGGRHGNERQRVARALSHPLIRPADHRGADFQEYAQRKLAWVQQAGWDGARVYVRMDPRQGESAVGQAHERDDADQGSCEATEISPSACRNRGGDQGRDDETSEVNCHLRNSGRFAILGASRISFLSREDPTMPQFWFFVKVVAIAIAVTSLPELWSIVRKSIWSRRPRNIPSGELTMATVTNIAREYSVGTFAYIDSLGFGLVPCKVERAYCNSLGNISLVVRVTAKRGAFKRGEIVEYSPLWIVPRNHVRRASGQFRNIGGYRWVLP
jgi:hypothetical protein